MEITILSQEARPLIGRDEVRARVFFQGASPSKTAMADALAETLKASRDLVVVKHIYTGFGDTSAEVVCYVYADAKVRERLEAKHLLEKHNKPAPAEEPAPEAPAAEEAPAEEAPAEEAASEAPAEAAE